MLGIMTLMPCYLLSQYLWQKIQNFGEPFLLAIHADEILANVKIRVQKKLDVSDEEFSKVVCLRTNYVKVLSDSNP